MSGFRSREITVLVATDVVGRGIDVEGSATSSTTTSPTTRELYPPDRPDRPHGQGRHRHLFVCPDQGEPLTAIESLTNKIVTPLRVEGFEPNRPRVQPKARELFNNTSIPRQPAMAR